MLFTSVEVSDVVAFVINQNRPLALGGAYPALKTGKQQDRHYDQTDIIRRLPMAKDAPMNKLR